jgi:hypothetical protein
MTPSKKNQDSTLICRGVVMLGASDRCCLIGKTRDGLQHRVSVLRWGNLGLPSDDAAIGC